MPSVCVCYFAYGVRCHSCDVLFEHFGVRWVVWGQARTQASGNDAPPPLKLDKKSTVVSPTLFSKIEVLIVNVMTENNIKVKNIFCSRHIRELKIKAH